MDNLAPTTINRDKWAMSPVTGREPSANSVCICVMADVTRVSTLRPLPRRVTRTTLRNHATAPRILLHRIIPQTRTLPN